jgi:hypothetical protein
VLALPMDEFKGWAEDASPLELEQVIRESDVIQDSLKSRGHYLRESGLGTLEEQKEIGDRAHQMKLRRVVCQEIAAERGVGDELKQAYEATIARWKAEQHDRLERRLDQMVREGRMGEEIE